MWVPQNNDARRENPSGVGDEQSGGQLMASDTIALSSKVKVRITFTGF